MTLGQLQQRLQKFNIRDEVKDVFEETKDDLKKLNQGQLFIGMKSDGHFLPDYSRASVLHYGKPAGPIRLYDTGAFWAGIKVDVRSSGFSFSDTDSKTPMLLTKYGRDVLGLANKTKNEEYIPYYFSPELSKRIELKLGLKA